MSILRVYDPRECNGIGVPLDWDQCRTCNNTGRAPYPDAATPESAADPYKVPICATCDGHGSLWAAALYETAHRTYAEMGVPIRCEDCGHPMSGGTWEGEFSPLRRPSSVMHAAELDLREHAEPWEPWRKSFEQRREALPPVYYSACDEECRHGGLSRARVTTDRPWHYRDSTEQELQMAVKQRNYVEASWRQVDVRCMGWPHDLRPEKLAILCLRCYVNRDAEH